SFYWRVAATFVVVMSGVLVAQSLVFSYLAAQSSPSFLSPNILAVTVAADMQEALAANPSLDLQEHLEARYGRTQPLYVVLADGRMGSNSRDPVPDDIRRAAAEQVGAGNLDARAVETGEDEIARVAHAFNRMAADLSARDAALRAAERQRRQMIADVSHELKTPLTSMRGYLETLRMPDLDIAPAERDRYIDTVERETHRLERIVQDLLDLARLEGGGATLERRVFAPERLFRHVIDRHALDARERDIELRTQVDASADQIVGDPHRLEQVIDNLVANALRHTPAG